MRREVLIGWATAVALFGTAMIGWMAWSRIRDATAFSRACRVATPTGTNYVVQLKEVAVGKMNAGYVLVVSMRLENPNPYPVTLRRENFILMDHTKEYYLPSMTGTQTPTIHLPEHGRAENEILSFSVPDEALAGVVALQVGWRYMVMLKDPKPFTRQLKSGEFFSFRRREW